MLADPSLGYFIARAVVVACALGLLGVLGFGARSLAKWVRRSMLEDIRDSIRLVTAADIAQLKQGQTDLSTEFAAMRGENTGQHAQMSTPVGSVGAAPNDVGHDDKTGDQTVMMIGFAMLADLIRPHRKAVAAFLTPIVIANLARFIPHIHVEPSLVEQLVLAAVTALTVHQTTNTVR